MDILMVCGIVILLPFVIWFAHWLFRLINRHEPEYQVVSAEVEPTQLAFNSDESPKGLWSACVDYAEQYSDICAKHMHPRCFDKNEVSNIFPANYGPHEFKVILDKWNALHSRCFVDIYKVLHRNHSINQGINQGMIVQLDLLNKQIVSNLQKLIAQSPSRE